MNSMRSACAKIEAGLVAMAGGEADARTRRRVHAHLERCEECRAELDRYRLLEAEVKRLRSDPVGGAEVARARARLESSLADLRSRLVAYGVFPSPFGPILLARSGLGVMLVEYLGRNQGFESSRLRRLPGLEAVEDGAEVEKLHRELRRYLDGRLTRLEWPLDLRLARSEFHREVLRAAAAIPYGAVVSYSGLAREVGRPKAVRAAAQALRWNPLPIVIPCHRVVGVTGSLVGYAGGEPSVKRKLLALEGIPTEETRGRSRIVRDAMYAREPGDKEYCLPTCPSVDPGAPPLHTEEVFPIGGVLFRSRERAEAVGLAPCKTCRPDLHPLSA